MDKNMKTDDEYYDREVIVCPVCHNHIAPYAEADVARAYSAFLKGTGICPFCGWSLPAYIDSAAVSEHPLLYKDISGNFPDYKWIAHRSDEYITDKLALLTGGETGIVASRPLNGEVQLIVSLMEMLREDMEVMDLYSGERKLTALCQLFDVNYKTMLEIDKKSKNPTAPRFDRLISEIRSTDCPDYIVLFGIQAVQETPFEPEEMRKILKELKSLALEKNTTIIIYSGLLRSCDVHTPSKEDLDKIGIEDNSSDLTIVLKNHKAVYFRGNEDTQ